MTGCCALYRPDVYTDIGQETTTQMIQIKKHKVRDAILVSAFDLFCRKGYTATTMADIARQAEVNIGTLYVYFESKLAILYALYRPWQEEKLRELAESVRKLRSPAMR